MLWCLTDDAESCNFFLRLFRLNEFSRSNHIRGTFPGRPFGGKFAEPGTQAGRGMRFPACAWFSGPVFAWLDSSQRVRRKDSKHGPPPGHRGSKDHAAEAWEGNVGLMMKVKHKRQEKAPVFVLSALANGKEDRDQLASPSRIANEPLWHEKML